MLTMILFLVVLAFIGLGIPLAVYVAVLGMRHPESKLEPTTRDECARQFELAKECHSWATRQGFAVVNGYVFRSTSRIFMAVWQRGAESVYFVMYVAAQNQRHYDFVTLFADEAMLTSGNSYDGALLPPAPDTYVEAFPGQPYPDLWQRHQTAQRFLLEQRGSTVARADQPFETVLATAVNRQIAHIRSLPFWPFRGLYWWFVRRQKMANRSVAEQAGT
ncbi:MAG: hypothetical protein JXR37_13330 [Kiritimatiellae bacterium]|nr:hypothetical protein [Kiritimatiellia bacterium]